MKKYLIISIIIAVIIFIVIPLIPKNNSADLQLYGSYTVDITNLREKLSIKDGAPVTFFLQLGNPEGAKEFLLKAYGLDIPDIDFNDEDRFMVISIGRELVDMDFTFLGEPLPPSERYVSANIVFGGAYHDQTVYVYSMKPVSLAGHIFTGEYITFYAQYGPLKILIGHILEDFNKMKPLESGPGV